MSKNSVLIEHTIRRAGGTDIPMPPSTSNPKGLTYKFRPSADHDNAHVATVSDHAHLTKFLQIPSFVLRDGGLGAASSSRDDDAEGRGGSEAEGASPADPTTDTMPVEDITPEYISGLDDDALAALHADLLGRKPHPKAKRTTLEAAINAEVEERLTNPDADEDDDSDAE